jgi:Camelysin metallo-endopeptidase
MKPISFIAGNKSRLLLLAAVATGVLGMQAGRGTLAFFTTSATSTGNVFTAGNLQMNVSDVNQGPLATVDTSITFANMKPGDTVYAPLKIKNVGSLPGLLGISYATSVVDDGNGGTPVDLAPGLTLAIKGTIVGAGSGTIGTIGADPTHACSVTNFGTSGIWSDSVQAATLMTAGAGPTSIQAVASPATGIAMPAVTGTETLCLQVVFDDPGASNTYNNPVIGQTNTTVVFTFSGLASGAAVVTGP